MKPHLQIIPMTSDHSEAVASIHFKELPTSILSRLGWHFLKDFYYRGLVSLKGFYGFVILWEGTIAGFITLSLDPKTVFKNLLKNNFGLLVLSLTRAVLESPRVVGDIFQAAWFFLLSYGNAEPADPGQSEILSFAVPADFRTREFYQQTSCKPGNELFKHALDFLRKMDKDKTFLMVETKNALARIFYKNMGMQETQSRSYFGLNCVKCEFSFKP